MAKYEIEYSKTTIHYTKEKLENVSSKYGIYDLEDDRDYLCVAVKHFCATHFMYDNAAHLDQYDAETRGRKIQEWKYQPNGNFKGWIYARTIED